MDEREILMQRFVDNELTAEERIRFLRMLDQDMALKRHLLDTEGMIVEASQLPRHVAPPGLAAQVRARLSNPRAGVMASLWRALWTPRALQWNVAAALVLTGLLLALLWYWMRHRLGG
ncbi:MAG: hypothetical protein ACREJU_13065 [Nitrospiraceae bacterium]